VTTTPAEVLITAPLPIVGAAAVPEIIFHRLWETSDRSSFLGATGPRIRGVAAAGSVRIDSELLDLLPTVEMVASFGVGYDRVDIDAARERGIIVTNTPEVLTEEVADLALGLLIATVRAIPQADRFVRAGRWATESFPLSSSLRGRTVGILGLGRIGKAIARRLDAADVRVVYHGRSKQVDVAYAYYASLLEMARAVDTLMLVAPGTAETVHLVNAEVLAALGPDGVLINISRGSVIDETALIAALRNRTILLAGLDVFEDEPRVPEALTTLDNVVLTPHVGSGSVYTRNAMGQLVLENLISWFRGHGPLTPVPETPWRKDAPRSPMRR
jgi:lactate dehydrogenase-like 2-hydroxyacid dehydrogenase